METQKQNLNKSKFDEAGQRALELWKADKQAVQKSVNTAKALGVALNKFKEACPHKLFNPWLKKHGIDRNRASYCMRVANGKDAKAKSGKKAALPKGLKNLTIQLTNAAYDRLALIAKAQTTELAQYVSNIVMEHAAAQETQANKILAAIASANQERERAVLEAQSANKKRAVAASA
jgi:hypothetical protein